MQDKGCWVNKGLKFRWVQEWGIPQNSPLGWWKWFSEPGDQGYSIFRQTHVTPHKYPQNFLQFVQSFYATQLVKAYLTPFEQCSKPFLSPLWILMSFCWEFPLRRLRPVQKGGHQCHLLHWHQAPCHLGAFASDRKKKPPQNGGCDFSPSARCMALGVPPYE